MPIRASDPMRMRAALLARFNGRTWAGGGTLYTRGTQNIALPAAPAIYGDILDLLNGRGSDAGNGQTVASAMQAGWVGAGGLALTTCGAFINAEDKVVLTATQAFTVQPNDWWGYLVATTATLNPTSGLYEAVAQLDWRRGVTTSPLIVTPVGGSAFFVPAEDFEAQSVVTLLRAHDEGDIDAVNPTASLEALEHGTAGFNDMSSRWLLDDDGHTVTTWTGAAGAPVWTPLGESLQALMGYSGREAVEVVGSTSRLRSDNPASGAIVLHRPLARSNPARAEVTFVRKSAFGNVTSTEHGDWREWMIRLLIGGPMGEGPDEHRHWLDEFLPYCRKGGRLSVYQGWGDPRRARSARVRAAGDEAFSLLYNSAHNGYRGRLLCCRDESEPDVQATEWEIEHLRHRFPVEMALVEGQD